MVLNHVATPFSPSASSTPSQGVFATRKPLVVRAYTHKSAYNVAIPYVVWFFGSTHRLNGSWWRVIMELPPNLGLGIINMSAPCGGTSVVKGVSGARLGAIKAPQRHWGEVPLARGSPLEPGCSPKYFLLGERREP